ncbi:unnamed protein product [Clonostachys rosea]|uniref:O-methyltransferase domain-containing protein n=1 Tax=Bionectria ochroleuca TaxID=29856 RepID=A0ABY6UEJ4_BIOOC|nr:unnamed protein product [Clonostachys rosea]
MSAITAQNDSQVSLLDLASNIMKQTAKITAYLEANNLPEPTFDQDAPAPPATSEYRTIHRSLVASLDELRRLTDGPYPTLRSFICQGNDLAAFHIAFEFEFFNIVPLDSGMELTELAEKAGLDVDRTGRVMRMLATHHVFKEPRPGYFVHTSVSSLYQRSPDSYAAGHYSVDEMLKAATGAAAALKASPFESDSEHCGFNTANGLPMFQFYAKNPAHAKRFAKAMAGATSVDRQISELRDSYDWNTLKGTVVDVGGGSGHVSVSLAQNFPHLNFVVQDNSQDMLDAAKHVPTNADVADRISYMKHDFFEAQPVKDAAAFFMRQCTHNWSDRDVVRIFKGMVPGLEASGPGIPFLINDTIIPEPGSIPLHEERALRQMDMLMMIGLGAKQRTKAEFAALLKEADQRYEIVNAYAEGSSMGLLEVQLKI